jgi:hypothetical protein
MGTIEVVLTSAGIAALVSGLFSIISQALERRARRDEMIFSKALDMAVQHTEMLMRVAEKSGVGVKLYDNVIKAETYYKWLRSLFEKGELPKEAEKFKPKHE